MPQSVLITGANGFIGAGLSQYLSARGYSVRRSTRAVTNNSTDILVGEIGPRTDWSEAVRGASVVVHLAGRAHVVNEIALKPLIEYRSINVQGTLKLARQAAEAKVKRFIFISSIGVNGNISTHPFTEADLPNPREAYAISKLEAEEGLRTLAQSSDMEIVIIRPPLVYGPGVKGNFLTMLCWLKRGVPLPLAKVQNLRSLVSLDNLVSFIGTCMDHPAAANQTFLVSDNRDLSTSELLQKTAAALGASARLFPLPAHWLEFSAGLIGKKPMAHRLLHSLQVDISKARGLLGWKPPYQVDESLRKTASYFLENK